MYDVTEPSRLERSRRRAIKQNTGAYALEEEDAKKYETNLINFTKSPTASNIGSCSILKLDLHPFEELLWRGPSHWTSQNGPRAANMPKDSCPGPLATWR